MTNIKVGCRFTGAGKQRFDRFRRRLHKRCSTLLKAESEIIQRKASDKINLGPRGRFAEIKDIGVRPQDDPSYPHLKDLVRQSIHVTKRAEKLGRIAYGVFNASSLNTHVAKWVSAKTGEIKFSKNMVPIWKCLEFGSRSVTIEPHAPIEALAYPVPGELRATIMATKEILTDTRKPFPPAPPGIKNYVGTTAGTAPFRTALWEETPRINQHLIELIKHAARGQ